MCVFSPKLMPLQLLLCIMETSVFSFYEAVDQVLDQICRARAHRGRVDHLTTRPMQGHTGHNLVWGE